MKEKKDTHTVDIPKGVVITAGFLEQHAPLLDLD